LQEEIIARIAWVSAELWPSTLQKSAKNEFTSNNSLSISLMHFLPCTNVNLE